MLAFNALKKIELGKGNFQKKTVKLGKNLQAFKKNKKYSECPETHKTFFHF